MPLEMMEAYANMKIELLETRERCFKLSSKLSAANKKIEELYSIEDIRPVFNIYDGESIYVHEAYKSQLISWLNGDAPMPTKATVEGS